MRRRGIRRFIRLPRSPARIRADIEDELRFDVEMHTAELMKLGWTAAAARERATADFGDLDATRRYCEEIDMQSEADMRRSNFVSDFLADATIAWRAMRRTPAFALVIMATLGLGIGANTAVFSVVRRVLITPLPYRAPEQLYRLYTAPSTPDADNDMLSAVEIADLAADSKSVAGVTEFGNYSGWIYTDDRGADMWQTASVSPSFFDVLGVRPMLGRAFSETDFVDGAPNVVIVSYSLWQRTLGGDDHVVGRRVQLNSVDYTIIGVLPQNFVAPTFTADALMPLGIASVLRSPRRSHARIWRAVARVRAGVSESTLQRELALLRPRIQSQYSDIKNAGVFRPVPLHAAIVGGTGPVLLVVMGAAALVLVVTCVNIAGLFLSRSAARRRELGVRAALGASRGRLIRQMITEGALYGVAGGAVGVGLAFVMKGAFVAVAGSTLPNLGEIRIDVGVLAFAAVVSVVCGIAVGLLPALSATRLDLRDALGDSSGRSASQGRSGLRGTRALVSAQVALAIVLIVGAGLLVRTFVGLLRTDTGYRMDAHTLTFHAFVPMARYPDANARIGFFRSLTARIHALPGVKSVGHTAVSPWNGGMMHVGVRVEGRAVEDNAVPSVEYATASEEFFSALGVPLKSGRTFNATDRPDSPPVILVSESVAERLWPNRSPVGAQVQFDTGGPDSTVVREVIGVVGDVRPDVLSDIVPTVYVAEGQVAFSGGEFVVRASGNALALVSGIKAALHDLDPRLPLIFPRTLRDVLAQSVARQQLAMTLIGAFALLALILAALGVYSVMAYAVVGRTREIGIRAALGAGRGSILGLILKEGLVTTAIGVACGLGLAALTTRLVAALLVGVSAHDPASFVAAAALLGGVATVACVIPALAATNVQPVDALRVE